MAITDAYATVAEYRDRVKKQGHDEDEATILLQLTAVSHYIERALAGRFFTVDASDATRVYRVGDRGGVPPGGRKVLTVDDLSADPTSIKIDKDNDGLFTDETALASTDYILIPRNAPLGPEAEPYQAIELTPWGDQATWLEGVWVEVVGKFGWPAVPEAIKQGTIDITGILRRDTDLATNRIVDDLVGAIEASPQSRALVKGLSKSYFRWGF
jgi:hypothetical protein